MSYLLQRYWHLLINIHLTNPFHAPHAIRAPPMQSTANLHLLYYNWLRDAKATFHTWYLGF